MLILLFIYRYYFLRIFIVLKRVKTRITKLIIFLIRKDFGVKSFSLFLFSFISQVSTLLTKIAGEKKSALTISLYNQNNKHVDSWFENKIQTKISFRLIDLLLVYTRVCQKQQTNKTQQLPIPHSEFTVLLNHIIAYTYMHAIDFKLSNNLFKLAHCIYQLFMNIFFGIFS